MHDSVRPTLRPANITTPSHIGIAFRSEIANISGLIILLRIIIIIRYMRRLLRLLLNLGRWIGELDLLYDEPQFVHVDLALICALPIYLFFRFVNY